MDKLGSIWSVLKDKCKPPGIGAVYVQEGKALGHQKGAEIEVTGLVGFAHRYILHLHSDLSLAIAIPLRALASSRNLVLARIRLSSPLT